MSRTAAKIVLVAAVARNGVIGRDGDMPWRLPSDLRRFRAITLGKPVVMGRRTYESIGRPLPGRHNLVVSRDAGFAPEGVEVVRDLDAALRRAADVASATGADEIAVIGGGSVYAALLDRADRLYVTHVDATPDGDTTFPEIDANVWRLAAREVPPHDGRDSAGIAFAVYDRRG